jgi:hypothetical protein
MKGKQPRPFLILVAALAGCSAPPPPVETELTTAPGQDGRLRVTLSAGKKPLTVAATYYNGTDEDVKLDKQSLYTDALMLKVWNGAGERRHTVPPPVPWPKPEHVVIAPQKTLTVVYSLDVFSPPLSPGRYRIRVSLDGWTSSELQYTLSE